MIIKHFSRPLLSKTNKQEIFFCFLFSLKLLVVFVLDDHQTLFQALYVKKQAKMKFQVFFFFTKIMVLIKYNVVTLLINIL